MPYLFFAKKEKCLQIKGMFKHLSGCLSGVVAQSCPTLLRPHGLQPSRLLCPLNSPGKNTGVGYHSLLQGIFPLQESNLGLLHWKLRVLTTRSPGKSQTLGLVLCYGSSVVKNPPADAGNTISIPGSGQSPGEGNAYPFQYSCLENPKNRGAWRATV